MGHIRGAIRRFVLRLVLPTVCTFWPQGNIMRSGHTYVLQLIPSLRHVWHSRRAQQHTVDTPSVNRGSQGSTGMVGTAQADDAVTRSDRRKAIGWLRRRSILGRWPLPTASISSCATRQQTLAQRSPRLTRYRWESSAPTTTSGWNRSRHTWRKAYCRHTLRGHSVAAPARRLACHRQPRLSSLVLQEVLYW
jgi:hypothetical protein